MKALVTGGAGFIGSHLVDELVRMGYEVLVVDDLRSGRREQIHQEASFLLLNILEGEHLQSAVAEFRPDIIFHLAAQPSVAASWQAPSLDAQLNIGGTLNVLLAAAARQCQVVYASSAACYGKPERLPIDEQHPTVPLSPYGVSKLAAEQYVSAFAASRGLIGSSLRLANVYGPRQTTGGEAGVVAAFIERARAGLGPLIDDDGQQTRDFVYIGDVVDAFIAAGRAASGVFNIGTGRACSINQLWQSISLHFPPLPPPTYRPARIGDIRHSVFATHCAYERMQWRAQRSLDEGLHKTCRS